MDPVARGTSGAKIWTLCGHTGGFGSENTLSQVKWMKWLPYMGCIWMYGVPQEHAGWFIVNGKSDSTG